jgi:hypothetical protein
MLTADLSVRVVESAGRSRKTGEAVIADDDHRDRAGAPTMWAVSAQEPVTLGVSPVRLSAGISGLPVNACKGDPRRK